MIARTNFIDGNVIFHQNPPGQDLKWLKAGGIFGVFKDHADLHMLNGIWSILSERNTPPGGGISWRKKLRLFPLRLSRMPP